MLRGRDIHRMAEDGLNEGLRKAAEEVLEQAKHNIGIGDPAEDPTPQIVLRRSGRIDRVGDDVLEVVFSTAYAAKQHEDQRLKHPRGGGPKYLERALTEVMPRMEDIVASEVRANVTSRRRS